MAILPGLLIFCLCRLDLQETEKLEMVAVKTKMAHATTPKLESYRLAIKLRTAAHFLEGMAIIK